MCNRGRSGDRKLGKSKGFGFVEYAEHRHALAALRQLNNNPSVFSAERRPIVEFSVENKMALNRKAYRVIKHQNVSKQAAAAEAEKEVKTPVKTATSTEPNNETMSKTKKTRKARNRREKKGKKEATSTPSASSSSSSKKEATTTASSSSSAEIGEPAFSGVMSKPLLKEEKVLQPKLNRRKLGQGKSELKKRQKAIRAEQKKAGNSQRHQKKLRRRLEAAEREKEKREGPEREAPHIDAHFEKRKRAFTGAAVEHPHLPAKGGELVRKKTKWFVK